MDPKVVPVTDEAPKSTPAYDEFSAAFDEGLTDPPKAEAPPAETPSPVDAAAAAVAAEETPPAAEETPPAAEETPPVAEETPAEETPPVAEEKPAEEPPVDDWKAKYEALLAEREKAQQPPQPEPQKAEAPQAEAAPEPPAYSKEEQEFLKTYEDEWPDIVKGETLRRRAEYQQLVKHVFSEIHRVYAPILQRAITTAEEVEDTTTLQTIRSVHADYDENLYNAVKDWAGKLTGYKARVAQGIIEQGDANDVVDLISEFKQSTGWKPKMTIVPSAAAPKPQNVTGLSAAAKKAAKALGVVDTKRTAASPTAPDPNDFGAAWNEAVGAK